MESRYFSHLSRRDFLRTAGIVVLGTGLVVVSYSRAQALSINPRSAWAIDRPPKGSLDPETVEFLVVHHSASRNGHTSAEAPAILRAFYDFHTGPEKGWNDIAYNFLIDAEGGIWEGRAGSLNGPVAGDATGGNQGFSQLVCLIGDYNAASPSAASKQSLAALLGWLADRYSVSTAPGAQASFVSRGSNKWPAGTQVTTPTITGHRTMSNTTCPGSNLYAYVTGGLVADVISFRIGSTPSTSPTTIVPAEPSSTEPETQTTSAIETTSSTSDPTTTPPPPTTIPPDPVPTIATTSAVLSAKQETETPTTTIDLTTTTTTAPVVVAAEATPAARSPQLWGGAVVASLATALLAWRHRRMGG